MGGKEEEERRKGEEGKKEEEEKEGKKKEAHTLLIQTCSSSLSTQVSGTAKANSDLARSSQLETTPSHA